MYSVTLWLMMHIDHDITQVADFVSSSSDVSLGSFGVPSSLFNDGNSLKILDPM